LPPVPPTKAPAPLTLDLLNNEINDLPARRRSSSSCRRIFPKHTPTYQGPKFEALTTVGALLNNPGGYQNYVVLLITPEPMKQSKGNLKETYTTGPAKY
jgi:hypothetical protein